MRINKLRLNPDKAQGLMVGQYWALGSDCTWMLDGFALPWKDQFCNLVVRLDLALLLDRQVATMARRAF